MLFIRFKDGSEPVSWSTRLLMVLGGIMAFSFLFFFAFTFFVVALVAMGVTMIAQFFLGKSGPEVSKPPSANYRAPRRDDDVIDI